MEEKLGKDVAEIKKPGCHNCKYKEGVPGSAHVSCHHPVYDDPKIKLLSLLQSQVTTKKTVGGLTVVGNVTGIRGGWFQHPMDFDPLWLMECSGYVEVQQ